MQRKDQLLARELLVQYVGFLTGFRLGEVSVRQLLHELGLLEAVSSQFRHSAQVVAITYGAYCIFIVRLESKFSKVFKFTIHIANPPFIDQLFFSVQDKFEPFAHLFLQQYSYQRSTKAIYQRIQRDLEGNLTPPSCEHLKCVPFLC